MCKKKTRPRCSESNVDCRAAQVNSFGVGTRSVIINLIP